jgi:hypothetical protein
MAIRVTRFGADHADTVRSRQQLPLARTGAGVGGRGSDPGSLVDSRYLGFPRAGSATSPRVYRMWNLMPSQRTPEAPSLVGVAGFEPAASAV